MNALRAFETAARLGGFTAAAEELNVTPGAVAQQVKNLEDWIGEPLFVRHSQGVRLTALGEETVSGFSAAFDQLGDAVTDLKARARASPVSIAALPSLAQCWLVPRLPDIRRALPNLMVSITALEKPPNLLREAFDISLFFEPVPSGPEAVRISEDRIYPVCAPEFAAALSRVDDLAGLPCLRDGHWQSDWKIWLNAAAPDRAVRVSGPQFSLYSLALDAAVSAGGILMGHHSLVAPLVARGDLIRPFDLSVATGQWLTLRHARPMSGAIDGLVAHLAASETA